MINWFIYYPIERYLSRFTDCLITINQEDYNLARKHRFHAKDIEYISGVGVDTEQFKPVDIQEKNQLRVAAGYAANDILLFNAGEFNKNKKQKFILFAMVYILIDVPNVKLLLAGVVFLLDQCK